MKAFYGAAFAACLLAGCNKGESTTNNMVGNDGATTNLASAMQPSPEATPTTEAAGYLTEAGAGDLFEIESSRAIMAKQPGKAVSDFAKMMVDAHTESTAKLKAAATSAKITVSPPALTPDQQANLAAIKAAEGPAAVTAYISSQREAHAKALALHQGYAAGGDTPALKEAAGKITIVVQHHIDMLGNMSGT